jgi:hypothetical protein
MGTANCTVGHVTYVFDAYFINKTTSSISHAEYRQGQCLCNFRSTQVVNKPISDYYALY